MAQITIIHKKQGMKSLIKKLVELQHFNVTVGIHSGFGRKLVFGADGKKKKINIATLAKALETYASWEQSKTVRIPNKDGETWSILKAGKRYVRYGRAFITILTENSTILNNFRAFLEKQTRTFIGTKSYSPRFYMDLIGSVAEDTQRFALQNGRAVGNADNSPFTIRVKGKNTPLQDTSSVLSPAISHKLNNDRNKLSKFHKDVLTIKDSMIVDKLIADVNRKK